MGPALGKAPASGPWGFRHYGTSRRQTPTSAQARRRAGNGEERGRTPALATLPRSRSRAPTSRTASAPPQGPVVSSPPRTSHSEIFAGPALGTVPARGPWGFRHHGTLRRQTPTSAQARRRAGNGEERGRTPAPQPRHAPALEPPASRRAYARLSQGPMVCYSRRALPAGRGPTVPQDRRRPPGRPI